MVKLLPTLLASVALSSIASSAVHLFEPPPAILDWEIQLRFMFEHVVAVDWGAESHTPPIHSWRKVSCRPSHISAVRLDCLETLTDVPTLSASQTDSSAGPTGCVHLGKRASGTHAVCNKKGSRAKFSEFKPKRVRKVGRVKVLHVDPNAVTTQVLQAGGLLGCHLVASSHGISPAIDSGAKLAAAVGVHSALATAVMSDGVRRAACRPVSRAGGCIGAACRFLDWPLSRQPSTEQTASFGPTSSEQPPADQWCSLVDRAAKNTSRRKAAIGDLTGHGSSRSQYGEEARLVQRGKAGSRNPNSMTGKRMTSNYDSTRGSVVRKKKKNMVVADDTVHISPEGATKTMLLAGGLLGAHAVASQHGFAPHLDSVAKLAGAAGLHTALATSWMSNRVKRAAWKVVAGVRKCVGAACQFVSHKSVSASGSTVDAHAEEGIVATNARRGKRVQDATSTVSKGQYQPGYTILQRTEGRTRRLIKRGNSRKYAKRTPNHGRMYKKSLFDRRKPKRETGNVVDIDPVAVAKRVLLAGGFLGAHAAASHHGLAPPIDSAAKLAGAASVHTALATMFMSNRVREAARKVATGVGGCVVAACRFVTNSPASVTSSTNKSVTERVTSENTAKARGTRRFLSKRSLASLSESPGESLLLKRKKAVNTRSFPSLRYSPELGSIIRKTRSKGGNNGSEVLHLSAGGVAKRLLLAGGLMGAHAVASRHGFAPHLDSVAKLAGAAGLHTALATTLMSDRVMGASMHLLTKAKNCVSAVCRFTTKTPAPVSTPSVSEPVREASSSSNRAKSRGKRRKLAKRSLAGLSASPEGLLLKRTRKVARQGKDYGSLKRKTKTKVNTRKANADDALNITPGGAAKKVLLSGGLLGTHFVASRHDLLPPLDSVPKLVAAAGVHTALATALMSDRVKRASRHLLSKAKDCVAAVCQFKRPATGDSSRAGAGRMLIRRSRASEDESQGEQERPEQKASFCKEDGSTPTQ